MRLSTLPLTTAALLASFLIGPSFASAQNAAGLNLTSGASTPAPTPAHVFLTWETETSVPQWYLGRALPTPGATIRVVLTALDEQGRLFSTEGQKIRWHANYQQQLAAQDKTEMTYVVPEYFSGTLLIKMGLFAGGKNTANTQISIPVVRPRLVVVVPYANKTAPQEDAVFQAQPFFFPPAEVDNLQYRWTIKNTVLPTQNLFGTFASLSFDGPGQMVPLLVSAESKTNRQIQASAQSFFSIE
jgi:hypothetical protein